MLAGPCTGARRRKLPTGHPSRLRTGAQVPRRCSLAQGRLGHSRPGLQLLNVRRFVPLQNVHSTYRVDAQYGAPVMRTGCPAYPLARQGLAAPPRGRPGRGSRLGLGGERPQGHRCPDRARGRARFHTLVPTAFWGRSPLNYPCGKAVGHRRKIGSIAPVYHGFAEGPPAGVLPSLGGRAHNGPSALVTLTGEEKVSLHLSS